MRTVPDFVCRIAGLPVSAATDLRAHASNRLLDQLHQLDKRLDSLRMQLSADLHTHIATAKNRTELINLRRDIFNGRQLTKIPSLPPHIAKPLRQYQAQQIEAQGLTEQFSDCFVRESAEIQQHLQTTATTDDTFRKGLLQSSDKLYRSLPRWKKRDKRGRKIERSIVRYWTRAALKTTPFSTFCTVLPGAFSDDATQLTLSEPLSFVRLNKNLYAALLQHFQQDEQACPYLHVELVPTLKIDAGRLHFLTNVKGRELFQRVGLNGVLQLLVTLLETHHTLPLCELIAALQTHPQIEATVEEATAYLDKLLAIGMLRFRTGIAEQDADWDMPLAALLRQIPTEDAHIAADLLTDLRRMATRYAAASVSERATIALAARQRVTTTRQTLNLPAQMKDAPFYEDCTADGMLRLAQKDVAAGLAALQSLATDLQKLAWPRGSQATMRRFFEQQYGRDAVVPLLDFYETYYREHFKHHLEQQQLARQGKPTAQSYDVKNPLDAPLIAEIQEGVRRVAAHVQRAWEGAPSAEQIDISAETLTTLLAPIPAPATPATSLSFFTQLIPKLPENGATGFVLPKGMMLAGYGKYFSRFLYMFPDAVRERMLAENSTLCDAQLAEICGDAAFNANLHPPLLPFEISCPTGESGAVEEQIRVADLVVRVDSADPHALILQNEQTQQRVLPVDLGFLNPEMRPPLFQLLSRFTTPCGASFPLPDTPNGEKEDIRHRPRIVYADHIVVARRQWQIAQRAFPSPAGNESAAAYALRLDRWRRANGIPQQVFMRVQVARQKNVAQDLYKPQYIDFGNPLLVELFGRTPNGLTKFSVTLEECLPAPQDALAVGEEQYVTELIVQLNHRQIEPAATPTTLAAAGEPQ